MDPVERQCTMKKGAKVLFVTYIIGLCWVLFIQPSATHSRIAERSQKLQHNFIPLKTLKRYAQTFPDYYQHHGLKTWITNVVGNVIMYIPFGFLLPLTGWSKTGFFHILSKVAAFSCLTEALQLLLKVGLLDVDDVLLNTLGGVAGWLAYAFLRLFATLIKPSS